MMISGQAEMAKTQAPAQEQRQANYSIALAREQVIAAQASAKTAKVAAWAALTAALTTAVGVIAQVIVAIVR
jgi:hypothetical protein